MLATNANVSTSTAHCANQPRFESGRRLRSRLAPKPQPSTSRPPAPSRTSAPACFLSISSSRPALPSLPVTLQEPPPHLLLPAPNRPLQFVASTSHGCHRRTERFALHPAPALHRHCQCSCLALQAGHIRRARRPRRRLPCSLHAHHGVGRPKVSRRRAHHAGGAYSILFGGASCTSTVGPTASRTRRPGTCARSHTAARRASAVCPTSACTPRCLHPQGRPAGF